MEHKNSAFWRFALILSLVVLAAAAYVKVPQFRALVDEKCPWIKEQLAKYGIVIGGGPAQGEKTTLPSSKGPVVIIEQEPRPSLQGLPRSTTDLSKLSSKKELWPTTVKLRRSVDFPKVVDGRPVGTIRIPKDTQVTLLRITDTRLGVIFDPTETNDPNSTGGTWVYPEETDIDEQVKVAEQLAQKAAKDKAANDKIKK